jgi:hypothetical protein
VAAIVAELGGGGPGRCERRPHLPARQGQGAMGVVSRVGGSMGVARLGGGTTVAHRAVANRGALSPKWSTEQRRGPAICGGWKVVAVATALS